MNFIISIKWATFSLQKHEKTRFFWFLGQHQLQQQHYKCAKPILMIPLTSYAQQQHQQRQRQTDGAYKHAQ